MSKDKGSTWKKWDLHVHTPESHLNNGFGTDWDGYVKSLFSQAIESEIAVIGITDYFTIEGYKKLKNDYLLNEEKLKELFEDDSILDKVKKIRIFPNIEFRLNKLVGSSRINFHIVFSNEVDINDIEENFLHEIDFVYEGNSQSTDEKWKLKNTNLSALGAKLKREHPAFNDSDIKTGMMNAVVDDSQITEILSNKPSKFMGKYLIIVPSDEDLSSLSWDGQDHQTRKVIIQKSHCFFAVNKNTIQWALGKKSDSIESYISEFKAIKPCLLGSDAHSVDKLFTHDTGKFCWIKAEPTFEGLRQVLYEPEARVFIGETQPREPINSIETIQLNFPQESKVGEDDFCFAGINHNFSLSSYFNCFIGGRGAGKSTILNLMGLHSINPESPQIFWNGDGKDKKKGLVPIGFDPSDDQIFSFTGTEKFEFLAQSEIESFARDKNKFTEAIYNRANANSGNLLNISEEKIQSSNSCIDEIITAILDLKSLEQHKINKEKEKRTLENSIKLFSSKEYKEIASSITQTTKELQDKENWTIKVNDLKDTLSSLVSDSILDDEDVANKNDFQKAYKFAIDKVKEAIDLLSDDKFSNERRIITALKLKLDELELNAKKITEKAGYSSDSVEQIKSAPQQISVIENEVKNLSKQIDNKNKVILRLDEIIKVLEEDKIAYEQKINEVIAPLQDTLKNQFEANKGKEIKHIALEYKFDEDSAWEALSTEFYDLFKSEYGDTESGKGVSSFIIENRLENF